MHVVVDLANNALCSCGSLSVAQILVLCANLFCLLFWQTNRNAIFQHELTSVGPFFMFLVRLCLSTSNGPKTFAIAEKGDSLNLIRM